MLIPLPQFEKAPTNEDERRTRAERTIKYLREAVAEAAKYGVTVCVEDTPTCNVPLCSTEEC